MFRSDTFRSSDHDPLILGLDLVDEPEVVPEVVPEADVQPKPEAAK